MQSPLVLDCGIHEPLIGYDQYQNTTATLINIVISVQTLTISSLRRVVSIIKSMSVGSAQDRIIKFKCSYYKMSHPTKMLPENPKKYLQGQEYPVMFQG
jgi:hypothetical protein